MLVVKVGGGATIDLSGLCRDLAQQRRREEVVLLHGASKELDRLSAALGRPPVTVDSVSGIQSRYTDDATLELFTMVYAGSAKVRIVERLQQQGVPAVGLCGVDGGLLRGPEKGVLRVRRPDGREQVVRGDRSGRVTAVNTGLLRELLAAGYLPVLSPPALSDQGRAMNVDGDRAAAQVAVALGADTLVLLTDVPGLLRDPRDASSLIADVRRHELGRAMEVARGRMRIKILAAREALQGGVRRVVLGDGRIPAPVVAACAGRGTVLRRAGTARVRS